jgi:ATP-dependent RNA helicase SUPV3L1/SUV3
VRSILAMLVDEGGIVAREAVGKPLAGLERDQRRMITRLKVKIGALDLFIPTC